MAYFNSFEYLLLYCNLNNKIKWVLVKAKTMKITVWKTLRIFRVDEKTRADTLIIKSIQECVARIEKLESQKSDKLIYKLPALNLCNASLV